MKAKIKVVKEFDLKLFIVKAGVRYWEDTEVNGESDTGNGDNIPCKEGSLWSPHIEIETGKIVNWEKGKNAKVHYKVCDCLGYKIKDEMGSVVLSADDGYVPNTLCPKDNGYGDYIIMDINEDGQIEDWEFDITDFENFVED